MSEEGEGTEEARKVVVSENEGNAAALSGELIIESVGSSEEEVKLNKHIPQPYFNIFKGPPSLEEARKTAAVNSVASDNYASE